MFIVSNSNLEKLNFSCELALFSGISISPIFIVDAITGFELYLYYNPIPVPIPSVDKRYFRLFIYWDI